MNAAFPFLLGSVLLVPAGLLAQPVTVCIFQTAPAADPAGNDSDAATLANTLSVGAGPHALTAIPVAGLAQKDQDAEAQKRGCSWIVELARDKTTQSSPSSSPAAMRPGTHSDVPVLITTTVTNRIAFTLRQPGSKKSVAHGSSSRPEWAALFPAEILKKIPTSTSP